jgi:hypothetical protein
VNGMVLLPYVDANTGISILAVPAPSFQEQLSQCHVVHDVSCYALHRRQIKHE